MSGEENGFRTLSIFDEDAALIEEGTLAWVPVRRRLGIGAFGVNAYRAANAGDALIEDHVESPGQEELYVVIRGRAEMVGSRQRRPSRWFASPPVPGWASRSLRWRSCGARSRSIRR